MDLQTQLQELTEENKNLRAEISTKSDYLSMMVHQLRTPLSATKWIFKMMMDGDLGTISEEQKNIIKRGYESNEQTIRMLAEVSEANHALEWRLQLHPEPTNIVPCIESVISEFTGEANTKKILLHFSAPQNTPAVLADKEKISIVMQNLIENAIKYTQPTGSVTIHAELFNKNLVISVTDTGIGIPPNEQQDIFKKFYRASNAKKAQKGTGLGLFVCKQIIEGHHGTIWFESVPDVGTTFFFTLPISEAVTPSLAQ